MVKGEVPQDSPAYRSHLPTITTHPVLTAIQSQAKSEADQLH